MSGQDTVVLRRVYAIDSNCGAVLSANQVLLTTSTSATVWVNVLSSLNAAGGPVIGNLPSTIFTLSSVGYSNTSTFTYYFSSTNEQISTLSSLVENFVQNGVSPIQLTSTVDGLGTSGYISSQQLLSTTTGIFNFFSVDYGYISGPTLTSTVDSLGTLGYISTQTLDSTIAGLADLGYISSSQLTSSLGGLGADYVSTATLQSTISSLTTAGFITSTNLTSTVTGLGSIGYVSSTQLISTTTDLTNFISNVSVAKANIQFDTTGTVNVYGSNTITFCNVSTVLYTSTIFFSSISTTGTGTSFNAAVSNFHVLTFSTAQFDLSPFNNYMISSTRITLDFYPQIAFTKLATGANAPALITMSSFLQIGNTQLLDTTVNNSFVASQTVFIQGYPSGPLLFSDASNTYASPIRMTFLGSSIVGNTASTIRLVHVLPSSLNNGGFQNALHGCNVTPVFGNPGGLYVSVQNIPK